MVKMVLHGDIGHYSDDGTLMLFRHNQRLSILTTAKFLLTRTL